MTMRALALRAEVSLGYVSMMEAAKLRAVPSAVVRRRIAEALGTTPAKLGAKVR
jgi:transcriptional regulator with XRE-family HTH domain